MLKVVVFDLWGTLAQGKIGMYIEQVNKLIGKKNVQDFTRLRREWYKKDKRDEDFFGELVKKVQNPYIKQDHLVNAWNRQIADAELFPETVEVLEALKKRGIKLALVSNSVPTGERALEKLGIHAFFDLVLFSFRENALKQEGVAFRKIIEYFKVKPNEILVVDDQLDAGKKQAEELGMHFVLVDREEESDYPDRVKDLQELFEVLEKHDH